MPIQNELNKAQDAVVTYLDAHGQLARKFAWGAVVLQIVLTFVITMGSVSSVLAAAGCLLTALVLIWMLVKTRPVAIIP